MVRAEEEDASKGELGRPSSVCVPRSYCAGSTLTVIGGRWRIGVRSRGVLTNLTRRLGRPSEGRTRRLIGLSPPESVLLPTDGRYKHYRNRSRPSMRPD